MPPAAEWARTLSSTGCAATDGIASTASMRSPASFRCPRICQKRHSATIIRNPSPPSSAGTIQPSAARRLSCSRSSRSFQWAASGPEQMRLRLLGEREECLRMASMRRPCFVRALEALGRELADRHEHRESRFAIVLADAQEALLRERVEPVEHIPAELVGGAADPLGLVVASAAGDDREAREQPAGRGRRAGRGSIRSRSAASAGGRAGRGRRRSAASGGRQGAAAGPRREASARAQPRARSRVAAHRACGRSPRSQRRSRRSGRSRAVQPSRARRRGGRPPKTPRPQPSGEVEEGSESAGTGNSCSP